MANRHVWSKWNRIDNPYYTYSISKTSVSSKSGACRGNDYSFNSSTGTVTFNEDTTSDSTAGGPNWSWYYASDSVISYPEKFYEAEYKWVRGSGMGWTSEIVAIYKCAIEQRTNHSYSKGTTSYGNVSAASSGAYPPNNYSGSYWYVYKGSDCIDPSAISYSTEAPRGGETVDITVTPRANTYGGTIKYKYEYSLDGGVTWIVVNSGTTSTTVSILIPAGSTQFQARVTASDDTGFTSTTAVAGAALTVTNNTAPVITCGTTALGEISAAFSVPYSVSDAEGNTMTVTEKLDNTVLRSYTTTGGDQTLTVDVDRLLRTLNGAHTLTITADDGNGGVTTHSISFTKAVYACSITLLEPMDADDRIALMVMHVVGQIPADAVYKVEVTNNAYDQSPVWENITNFVKNGWNYEFTNTVCTAGKWGFNFRISIERGEGGIGGYVESVSGGFQGKV